MLSAITGIDISIFGGSLFWIKGDRNTRIKGELRKIPVARKMSWAANGQTTRVEDRAYSLLGLFGVNMPLLYGEGNKASLRLQEEIIRYSNDDSIFAWEFIHNFDHELYENQLLAPSPEYFSWWSLSGRYDVELCSSVTGSENVGFDESFEITQKALHITVPLLHWRTRDRSSVETTRGTKNRTTYEINFEGTMQRSDLREGDAKEADSVKMAKTAEGSSTSRRSSENDSNKTGASEESSSDEDSFQGRLSEDHISESECSVNFSKSQALLKCHHGFLRVALRVSHTCLGDRRVISQVISQRPGGDEIRRAIRLRMGLRLGERHRLALYLGVPETTAFINTQSIMIRRDGDMNNFICLGSDNAIGQLSSICKGLTGVLQLASTPSKREGKSEEKKGGQTELRLATCTQPIATETQVPHQGTQSIHVHSLHLLEDLLTNLDNYNDDPHDVKR